MISDIFKNIINNSLDKNKLSQVYLISSKNLINFDEYFLYFINNINKENFSSFMQIKFGDLYYFIDGKNQSINKHSILNAINETTESSILSKNKKKILIINNIENASIQSSNSLLKFLENPPFNTIIILSCNFISNVLKTIKSRAFIIELNDTLCNENSNLENKEFSNFFKITNSLYDEDIIPILNEFSKAIYLSYKNPSLLFELIIKHLDYLNKDKILDFLYLAFLDIYKIKKNISSTLILDDKKTKKENFDYIPIYKILSILKQTKEALDANANFNLQKSNLLIKLEDYYGL